MKNMVEEKSEFPKTKMLIKVRFESTYMKCNSRLAQPILDEA